MLYASTNDLQIAYETFGDPADKPLLLIMGLASQMLIWDERFCDLLAQAGHYVIRFDNRDVGLSTRLPHLGRPNPMRATFDAFRHRPVSTAYTLDDMADDTLGLMDALGIRRGHLFGASMGGMIAQTVAIRYPERVASLTSAMSSTGNPRLPGPTWAATRILLRRPPREKDAFIDYTVDLWRTIGSPGYPFDEALIRKRSARIYDRGLTGSGAARQLVAIIAHGDRRPGLARLTLPSLIIHGQDDPLIRVQAGLETASTIPGAELLLLPGVGHTLPREIWPQVIEKLCALTKRGDDQHGAS